MAVSRIEVTTAFEDCAEGCKDFVLHEDFFKEYETGAVYMILRGCKNTDLCTRIAEKVREDRCMFYDASAGMPCDWKLLKREDDE